MLHSTPPPCREAPNSSVKERIACGHWGLDRAGAQVCGSLGRDGVATVTPAQTGSRDRTKPESEATELPFVSASRGNRSDRTLPGRGAAAVVWQHFDPKGKQAERRGSK
ncbi:hypothetical protein AAFF_G00083970 [Aldrovandia affinis]|uniref:Uncharacterized protein n=1 Tax=Aldrovandia affinis TaxID=143900 RepID=A0AAD7RZM9_9TELE|nr:hypothetical protein AAFF_G00083970 [Aldrovandia affinis]